MIIINIYTPSITVDIPGCGIFSLVQIDCSGIVMNKYTSVTTTDTCFSRFIRVRISFGFLLNIHFSGIVHYRNTVFIFFATGISILSFNIPHIEVDGSAVNISSI